jgi:hypothetical protein
MRAMSIVGIILFTWLLYNRIEQYQLAIYSFGKTVVYTHEVVERAKNSIIPVIIVSAYALVYATAGTHYYYRNKRNHSEIDRNDKAQ